MTMSHNPRFSPENALERLDFLAALKQLFESSGASLDVISSEEIFDVVKETLLFAKSYFLSTAKDFRSVNPTIIVGQTNTSSDKTVAGTVESRRYFERRPYPLPVEISTEVNKYIDQWYRDVYKVQQWTLEKDFKSLSRNRQARSGPTENDRPNRRAVRLSYLLRKRREKAKSRTKRKNPRGKQ